MPVKYLNEDGIEIAPSETVVARKGFAYTHRKTPVKSISFNGENYKYSASKSTLSIAPVDEASQIELVYTKSLTVEAEIKVAEDAYITENEPTVTKGTTDPYPCYNECRR